MYFPHFFSLVSKEERERRGGGGERLYILGKEQIKFEIKEKRKKIHVERENTNWIYEIDSICVSLNVIVT